MQANRSLYILVLLASCFLLLSLAAKALPHGDYQDSLVLTQVSRSSTGIGEKGGPPSKRERDLDLQASDGASVRSDFSSLSTSTRMLQSEKAYSPRLPALRKRYNALTNLAGGGRLRCDAFAAITPSIYAAHALDTIFTWLYNTVMDSWSRQPPRETFEVRYGALRLYFYRRDQVIPWDFVVDLAL
ncbi:MAG: hypothetical protein Q9226_006267 [Calogaya cf. arnoldii]